MNDDETGAGSARARLMNSLVLGVLQQLSEASQRPPAAARPHAGDVVLGLGAVAVEASRRVTEGVGLVLRPLAAMLAPPSVVTAGPTRLLRGLAERGREERADAASGLEALAQRIAPRVLDRALDLVDLTDLVRDHVDLDTLVADVDVDAVAARLDLDAILNRVDVDQIAARLDVDAVAARIDLDAILNRVEVDQIAARLDVDEVAGRIDLDAILNRVDIDQIAARLDIDAVVARLDLVALAEFVVEGIDLPGIIQSSTGSMASVARREVRWQGIGADERVEHIVDRMLRRGERRPGTPSEEPLPWEERQPQEGALASAADTDQPGPVPPPGGYGLAH
jgi:hypothetical protein